MPALPGLASTDTPKARVDAAIANFKKSNASTGAATGPNVSETAVFVVVNRVLPRMMFWPRSRLIFAIRLD